MPRYGVCGAITWGACCDPISVYVEADDDDGDTVIRGSD